MKKFVALFISLLITLCLTGAAKQKSVKEQLAELSSGLKSKLAECKRDLELVSAEIAKLPEGQDDLVSMGLYENRSLALDCIERSEEGLARIDRVSKNEAVTLGGAIVLGPVIDGLCDEPITPATNDQRPCWDTFASLLSDADTIESLNECYAKELVERRQTGWQGNVTFKLVIEPTGKVAYKETKSTSLNNPIIERCALDVLGSIQYPVQDKQSIVTQAMKFE